MIAQDIGEAAVANGWRKKAADTIAPRLGRSPLPGRERDVRAVLGLVFLALSVKYVAGTLTRLRHGR